MNAHRIPVNNQGGKKKKNEMFDAFHCGKSNPERVDSSIAVFPEKKKKKKKIPEKKKKKKKSITCKMSRISNVSILDFRLYIALKGTRRFVISVQ